MGGSTYLRRRLGSRSSPKPPYPPPNAAGAAALAGEVHAKRMGDSEDLHSDFCVSLCSEMRADAARPGLCGDPCKCSCHDE